MERPKMQAVRFMDVSLSNMPCVSISSTATSSPVATRRMKGSDHIQMPVVVRSFPARHWKLDSVALEPCMHAGGRAWGVRACVRAQFGQPHPKKKKGETYKPAARVKELMGTAPVEIETSILIDLPGAAR